MKRIIKLTESDLEQIVKKVLKEQSVSGASNFGMSTPQSINPKNLRIGDGGTKSPQKKNDVKILQQKLINLGLLKTKTGRPTGFFGNLTDEALKKYLQTSLQKKMTVSKPTQPEKEDSWTDKVKNFCLSPLKGLESLKNSFNLASLNPLPPHWRAFMSFLLGRTEPINADFFKPEELKLIADRVNSYFPSNSKCRKNKKCYVSFYQNTDWSKVKTGQEKVLSPELGKAIGLTIGNGQVIDNGDSYIVKDIYDFNNFKNNPSAYSPEKAGSTVKAALNKITCGNYIQGIEELASFKQAKGYKGIPVEIQIPKTV
jgi:peptidoglycan hydrolase-like protein with peptidoglycan-binding domain